MNDYVWAIAPELRIKNSITYCEQGWAIAYQASNVSDKEYICRIPYLFVSFPTRLHLCIIMKSKNNLGEEVRQIIRRLQDEHRMSLMGYAFNEDIYIFKNTVIGLLRQIPPWRLVDPFEDVIEIQKMVLQK